MFSLYNHTKTEKKHILTLEKLQPENVAHCQMRQLAVFIHFLFMLNKLSYQH